MRPQHWYGFDDVVHYVFIIVKEIIGEESMSYKEVIANQNQAMVEEMESLKKRTWILIKIPTGQKLVGCKWIYKLKDGIPGIENAWYKVRLVAKVYT